MLAAARKIATPAQRQALPERESEGAIRGSSGSNTRTGLIPR